MSEPERCGRIGDVVLAFSPIPSATNRTTVPTFLDALSALPAEDALRTLSFGEEPKQ